MAKIPFYIQNLINQGENQHLDFKYVLADAKKIARTFSAFANTEGGTLLIGVKDNGVISGIKADEELYMIESAAEIYCKPQVSYQVIPWKILDKTILEVKVEESENKPHIAPWKNSSWKAFVRVNDQNFMANNVLTEVWKRKHQDKALQVKYNDYEQRLFMLMREKNSVNFDEIVKLLNIKPYLAVKILANLVTIGVVHMDVQEYQTFYSLD